MMAQSLGADIDGNQIISKSILRFMLSRGKRGMITENVRNSGAILVSQDGHRFVDEEHRRMWSRKRS